MGEGGTHLKGSFEWKKNGKARKNGHSWRKALMGIQGREPVKKIKWGNSVGCFECRGAALCTVTAK